MAQSRDNTVNDRLRLLPSVDELCRMVDPHEAEIPRWAIVKAARRLIDARRQALLGGSDVPTTISRTELESAAKRATEPTLREVLNASGVVVHTNLGRAPLAQRALERLQEVGAGYSTLEYDLEQGHRGSRHVHAAELLCELTGAEDAAVVNNNAAAVMLCLAAMASGREVIVSRGELIEIGGSFRIPDVMKLSGAELVEVGTTNRTHPADYEAAINEETGLLLKVHPSNYAIVGFTREVLVHELVQLGTQHRVPTLFDLGSGALQELEVFRNQQPETTVQQAVAAGFDLVTFSGDKLVGGPQAGIIVGKKEAVERVRKHPMMRALRPDKLCFAALEATLELYRDQHTNEAVPVLRMLSTPKAELEKRATKLATLLALEAPFSLEVVPLSSRAGGGSYPIADVPSFAVKLNHAQKSARLLESELRQATPPVVCRIIDDRVHLDLLTIEEPQLERLATTVRAALAP